MIEDDLKNEDHFHRYFTNADKLVAKAYKISEVGQIARMEYRLREYFEAKWKLLQRKAIKEAKKMANASKPASQISSKVMSILSKWPGQVKTEYLSSIEEMYKKARTAAWKKIRTGSKANLTYDPPSKVKKAKLPDLKEAFKPVPKFDLKDKKAMKALKRSLTFWLKEHMQENITPTVKNVVKEVMLEAGEGRVAAGRAMEEALEKELGTVKTPSGWVGGRRQYFEGLAAVAATTSRAHGHLRSFVDFEVEKYQIVNPMDERTCKVCSTMDGKVFTVDQGTDLMEDELEAKSSDDVKEIHPWYNIKQLDKITTGKGNQGPKDSKALAGAGYALPPFHLKCRCVVDMVD